MDCRLVQDAPRLHPNVTGIDSSTPTTPNAAYVATENGWIYVDVKSLKKVQPQTVARATLPGV